jgi:AAA domain-containing protein/primase-like protein
MRPVPDRLSPEDAEILSRCYGQPPAFFLKNWGRNELATTTWHNRLATEAEARRVADAAAAEATARAAEKVKPTAPPPPPPRTHAAPAPVAARPHAPARPPGPLLMMLGGVAGRTPTPRPASPAKVIPIDRAVRARPSATEWERTITALLGPMSATRQWTATRGKNLAHPLRETQGRVNDPATFGTLDELVSWYRRHDAEPLKESCPGFVFQRPAGASATAPWISFVDIDRCLDDAGRLKPWARPLVEPFLGATYVERSPGGHGLHVFALARPPWNPQLLALPKPPTGHSVKVGDGAVEVYDDRRLSTVTGIPFRKPTKLGDAQPALDALFAALPELNAKFTREVEESSAAPLTAEEVAAELPKARAAIAILSRYRDEHPYGEPLGLIKPETGDLRYEPWVNVCQALQWLGRPGLDLWIPFCAGGRSYVPGEPNAKWASFSPRPGGVTLRTLYAMADKIAGGGSWRPDDGPSAEEEFAGLPTAAVSANGNLPVIPLDQVAPEKVDWLWKGRIARGHITLVAGNPGACKSIMTLALAALVSRGAPLPGEKQGRRPARVLLLNAEDGQADTLRPRAEAAGADLARVIVLDLMHGGRVPQLPEDVAELERIIVAAGDVDLVVLDPLNACIPMKLDAHKDQHVRQALAPLAALAQRRHVAIALVAHLNKANDAASALYRVSGSIGLGAAARSVLFVGPHPEDEARRVVAQAKPQLGPPPPSLAFEVRGSEADPDVGVVHWLGEVAVGANDLVRKPEGEKLGAVEKAEEWLREALADGPIPSKQVLDDGEAAGFSRRTLFRAKKRIDVWARRTGGAGARGEWMWELPGEDFKEES